MKTNQLMLFVFFLFMTFNSFCQPRQDSVSYFIETVDGNTFTGVLVEEDDQKVVLKTQLLGEITVLRTNIKKMELIIPTKMKEGQYWFDNPQATRYFFSPNGYGLKAGEGYYQNVWVLFNSFAVGVTDNISIGAGMVPLFFFGESTPMWITPKFSIPVKSDKFNLGGGALIGTVLGEENAGFGIVYGLVTSGSKDNNVTFGMGYGYAGGDWAQSPMLNFNGMFRTGARGYFITENYFINGADANVLLISLGGRQIIKNAGLDYGLLLPFSSEMDQFIAIPWLGITLPFGNKTGSAITK